MKFDGGKAVVQRILQAYGFTMQKQLHDHLGVGNGTVSTWIKRNYFPGEVVIRCALETGVDLEWLATGIESEVKDYNELPENKDTLIVAKRVLLENGQLNIADSVYLDRRVYPTIPTNPMVVQTERTAFIADDLFTRVNEGTWLIKKGELYSISSVQKLPKNMWKIDGIDWPHNELQFISKILCNINYFN